MVGIVGFLRELCKSDVEVSIRKYLPLGIRNLAETPRKPALLVQPTLEKLEPLGSLGRVAIKIRVVPHRRIETHGRPVDKESVEVFSPKSAREGHVLRGGVFDDGEVS